MKKKPYNNIVMTNNEQIGGLGGKMLYYLISAHIKHQLRNKIWYKFGILLGSIVSPIIMAIVFFLVVTPIGIIMRLIGKDVLNLKYRDYRSYWIEKTDPKSTMKNQF